MLERTTSHLTANAVPINPTAQRMLDIIMARSNDGEPTTDQDLEEFTPEQIKAHLPAAKRLASQLVVRQVEHFAIVESRAQQLKRAAGLVAGLMPTEAQIQEVLRRNDFTNTAIAELWPDLITCSAQTFVTRRLGHQ